MFKEVNDLLVHQAGVNIPTSSSCIINLYICHIGIFLRPLCKGGPILYRDSRNDFMGHLPNGRSHVRFNVIVLLQYKKLTDKECEAYTGKEYKLVDQDLSVEDFTLQPFMEDTAKEEEAQRIDPFIVNNLIDINLKLNLILTMLSSNREPSIFSQRPVEVNLSEGGIAFVTRETFEKGDFLQLTILLPVFPIALIRARGEVVRSTSLTGNNRVVGIKFIDINEENQDKIVCYLFKKERERLRNKNF